MLKPTAGPDARPDLAACALVFPNRVDDERKLRARNSKAGGITRMTRRASLHPKLHRHNRLASVGRAAV